MTKIDGDLRFVEIGYELWGLAHYRETLEEQIIQLADQKKREVRKRLASEGLTPDDPEYSSEVQQIDTLTDEVLPRFFRGPFLISLWAVFESGMNEIGEYLGSRRATVLRPRDIRGRDPKDTWAKYFDHVVKYPLGIDDTTWQRLDELREVRNAMAHANGRVELLAEPLRRKIEEWCAEQRGLSTYFGLLIIAAVYVRDANELVDDTLSSLIARVRKDFGA
jgi:hypothetical protein